MASSFYDDTTSSDSNISQSCSPNLSGRQESQDGKSQSSSSQESGKNLNVVNSLINRQMYGRFTKHPKSKTERIFNTIHYQCRFSLDQLIIRPELLSHIFMGFTLCGRFFISYKETVLEDSAVLFPTIGYELYIWKFVPGQHLKFISKHRIFKLLKGSCELDEIMFLQFPTDPYKVICYGSGLTNPVMAFITVLTLPVDDCCKHCKGTAFPIQDHLSQGWCLNHGFMLHFMFSMAHPTPTFNPHISLSFPDHLVINTGHYIHILNVSSFEPQTSNMSFSNISKEEDTKFSPPVSGSFIETFSETSEAASDSFGTNSVVEAILEDFSEYDLEGNDCNKPFHELNISCEPLNVTGKSYHNTLVQNIVDPRLKRLQNSKDCLFSVPQCSSSKAVEKSKIDKKIAEKAYEFTEENEKCEKLSSFRKKRLADKKYEFSEDNTENIVPYHTLRREKRFLYRSQSRYIRSPEYTTSLFLSPRSSGIRSPMQSPSSRSGQFSPGGVRHLYCPSLRNSPHHSKSPISPKESARKFNVYSPTLDSDCSDYDSKLILRHVNNYTTSNINEHRTHQNFGLLIVDTKKEEASKWIKKLVRRYSSADFETSSLLSGQSRDDYNIPIEIPLIVQTLSDQHLDIVPEFKADEISETQLIITQRTFDCERFVQRRAQHLCAESHLEFLHCEDYDIKLLYVCPINGHIVCQAVIKIGALKLNQAHAKPNVHLASCLFTWNIASDTFELIESPENCKLSTSQVEPFEVYIPPINHKTVLVMDFNCHSSKTSLRDYNNYFEITMQNRDFYRNWLNIFQSGYSTVTDSD